MSLNIRFLELSEGLENEFESTTVNKLSVLEPLRFYSVDEITEERTLTSKNSFPEASKEASFSFFWGIRETK